MQKETQIDSLLTRELDKIIKKVKSLKINKRNNQ